MTKLPPDILDAPPFEIGEYPETYFQTAPSSFLSHGDTYITREADPVGYTPQQVKSIKHAIALIEDILDCIRNNTSPYRGFSSLQAFQDFGATLYGVQTVLKCALKPKHKDEKNMLRYDGDTNLTLLKNLAYSEASSMSPNVCNLLQRICNVLSEEQVIVRKNTIGFIPDNGIKGPRVTPLAELVKPHFGFYRSPSTPLSGSGALKTPGKPISFGFSRL